MISFYPGPSQVYPRVPEYVHDAYRKGILGANHRSDTFIEISREVIRLMQEKLGVPNDYLVFYASSATECWEIISQSLVNRSSYHAFNGAFGEKWYNYASRLQPHAQGVKFNRDELPGMPELKDETDLIALTHNETSNGTRLPGSYIKSVKEQYPDVLLAIDATSSLAGEHLQLEDADIWYASVQKCFGLPAGMAVMVCSPRAVQRARQINERNHYNSLAFMIDKMQDYQTTHTPNVLNIYLLMRTLQDAPPIKQTYQKLLQRYSRYERMLSTNYRVKFLISNEEVRSHTVIPFTASGQQISVIRNQLYEAGFIIGNGYGSLKSSTLRIANFPALTNEQVNAFMVKFSKIISQSF
jgi:phosphoserine aminotransferase